MKANKTYILMIIIGIYILGMGTIFIYYGTEIIFPGKVILFSVYIFLLIFNIWAFFLLVDNVVEDMVKEAEKKTIPNYEPVRNHEYKRKLIELIEKEANEEGSPVYEGDREIDKFVRLSEIEKIIENI